MRIALVMKLGAATAGGLIALACAWTLVCVIAFTRVLEGVERRHGRSFDEAHPGWASRDGEARIGGANGANPRPRRVGPFDGDDDGGGPDGAIATDSSGDCYPTCDPDAARRLDHWLGHRGFRDAMAGPPILPRWEEFLAERGPATHVAGGPDFHGEWEAPPDPTDVLNHWLGHSGFEAAMRGDLDRTEFDPHRRVWVREGGWMAGGGGRGGSGEGEWTVAARENAGGGDPNVLARMDEAVREYERRSIEASRTPATAGAPDDDEFVHVSTPGLGPGLGRRRRRRNEEGASRASARTKDGARGTTSRAFAGRIRVVIAATPTRREHLTKALLPALAAEIGKLTAARSRRVHLGSTAVRSPRGRRRADDEMRHPPRPRGRAPRPVRARFRQAHTGRLAEPLRVVLERDGGHGGRRSSSRTTSSRPNP